MNQQTIKNEENLFFVKKKCQCDSSQGGQLRDTQSVISHFYDGFLINSR